jgi:hypothetical protein
VPAALPDPARFEAALRAIDAANAEDPVLEREGEEAVPRALLYSRRMTEALERFAPDAPEVVQLAVRAQHLRRFALPRSDYPMDRAGYKQWRTDCARMHAEQAGRILRAVGYDEATVERVAALLQKKKLKVDPDVQLLEDVVCLVFLEHYLGPFVDEHADEREKVVGILRKTWVKMSERGHVAALALELRPRERALVEAALGGG